MKLIKFIVIILLLAIGKNSAQKLDYEFLPSGLNFMPLKANIQEARLGILYFPENGHLTVDVGNSIDLFALDFDSLNRLTFGIEFMAYASSTNFQDRRLQIDAIDGMFGGNAAYRRSSGNSNFLMRFRIIHNSAHLVDGSYDNNSGEWSGGQNPIPFTQDYGELIAAHELLLKFGNLKYYGGVTYATLTRPSNLEEWSFNAGIEINFNKIISSILRKEVNLFLASQLIYAGKPDYKLSSNNLLGIKFGNWHDKGIVLYLSYFKGNNKFNEFYYQRVSQFGIGFIIDYF